MARAASLVAPSGYLVIALYAPTWCDAFWIREKRWYAGTSPAVQRFTRRLYGAFLALRWRLAGRASPYADPHRGMELEHDLHDWLGGYPYETISADEVEGLLHAEGFMLVREHAVSRARRPVGLFGNGCDEYSVSAHHRRPFSISSGVRATLLLDPDRGPWLLPRVSAER